MIAQPARNESLMNEVQTSLFQDTIYVRISILMSTGELSRLNRVVSYKSLTNDNRDYRHEQQG